MMKIAMKMKNKIRAMPPAAEDMPEKPSAPAISEITKAMSAHFSNDMSFGPSRSLDPVSMRD